MQDYKIFNAEHDRIVSASFYKNDMIERDPESLQRLKQLLADFATGTKIEIADPDVPRTFLLDCSGSMRGKTIATMVAAMVEMGDALDAAGAPFEILGHTTSAWKGGRPRVEWLAQDRPPLPGRLNELLHITIKERDDNWHDVRDNVYGLMHEGLLKENIDGEAIIWAADRMRAHDVPGKLIICSDGEPIDDATLACNDVDFLKNHLVQVLKNETSDGLDIEAVLMQNGYGRSMSKYIDKQEALLLDTRSYAENTAALVEALGAAMAMHERRLEADADTLQI